MLSVACGVLLLLVVVAAVVWLVTQVNGDDPCCCNLADLLFPFIMFVGGLFAAAGIALISAGVK